jgi:hypothetical protein
MELTEIYNAQNLNIYIFTETNEVRINCRTNLC